LFECKKGSALSIVVIVTAALFILGVAFSKVVLHDQRQAVRRPML